MQITLDTDHLGLPALIAVANALSIDIDSEQVTEVRRDVARHQFKALCNVISGRHEHGHEFMVDNVRCPEAL